MRVSCACMSARRWCAIGTHTRSWLRISSTSYYSCVTWDDGPCGERTTCRVCVWMFVHCVCLFILLDGNIYEDVFTGWRWCLFGQQMGSAHWCKYCVHGQTMRHPIRLMRSNRRHSRMRPSHSVHCSRHSWTVYFLLSTIGTQRGVIWKLECNGHILQATAGLCVYIYIILFNFR